jgi:hypothetical protein
MSCRTWLCAAFTMEPAQKACSCSPTKKS